MESLKAPIFKAIITIIAGILLCVLYSNGTGAEIFNLIIYVIATLFLVPTFVILVYQLSRKDTTSSQKMNSAFQSIAAILLGILLFSMPEFFIGFIPYLFAIILTLAGIYQILTLSIIHRGISFGFGFYIVPSIITLSGVLIIVTPLRTLENWVVLISGIALIIYGIQEIFDCIAIRKMLKKM